MSPSSRLSLLLALGAAVAARNTTHAARQSCSTYTVTGIPGGFTERTYVDFTTAAAGGSASSFLSEYGIYISDYSVATTPVGHTFTPDNVALSSVSGVTALDLKTDAYTGGNVVCAEISTGASFTYASVRTVLQSSPTAGIVEGNFFYHDDNQEIDFEILTTTALSASADLPAGIWATNQPTTPGGSSTYETIPFSFDPSAAFHEYRIDWSSSATTFYIDGSQVAELTTNIPSEAGEWIWNVWSSGDPEWSAGPPTADAHTYIKSIDMYTGYVSTATGTTCSIDE